MVQIAQILIGLQGWCTLEVADMVACGLTFGTHNESGPVSSLAWLGIRTERAVKLPSKNTINASTSASLVSVAATDGDSGNT